MTTNYFRLTALAALAVIVSLPGQSASAGTITFTNQSIELQGTGLGNVLDILFVHQNKAEFGSVTWDGAADVETDDAINQSQTRTVAELAKVGITSAAQIGLILNIAESGNAPDINVFDFSMRFTDSNGVPLFADAIYTAPGGGLNLTQVSAGVGGSGWVFAVNLSPAEETALFASDDNRIGMLISEKNAFTDTSGAPDGFFVAPVPEPTSWAMALLGLIGLLVWRRKR